MFYTPGSFLQIKFYPTSRFPKKYKSGAYTVGPWSLCFGGGRGTEQQVLRLISSAAKPDTVCCNQFRSRWPQTVFLHWTAHSAVFKAVTESETETIKAVLNALILFFCLHFLYEDRLVWCSSHSLQLVCCFHISFCLRAKVTLRSSEHSGHVWHVSLFHYEISCWIVAPVPI